MLKNNLQIMKIPNQLLKLRKKYKTLKIKVKVVIKQINFILGNFKKVISHRKNRTSFHFWDLSVFNYSKLKDFLL